MKNIQVIDAAENCSFSICAADDGDFAAIFPGPGQDVEFVEDLVQRLGEERASALVHRATIRRVPKQDAMGVHGTLFFNLPKRRKFFPNKREDDLDKPNLEALL